MVSDIFKRDYRKMVAEGVKFTPEDIIRLNALAVKVTRAPRAARELCLPRLAFLPRDSHFHAPLVLREPTIAHELWIEMVERYLDTSKLGVFLFLHGFALSRRAEKLPDPTRPKKVMKAVMRFSEKRLAKFTQEQLKSAVWYALFGNDWTAGEEGSEKKAKREGEGASPTIGLLTESRILRLGISTEEAKRMTASELAEAINRVLELDGKFDAEGARNAALSEYVRAREEIRSRSTEDQPDDKN